MISLKNGKFLILTPHYNFCIVQCDFASSRENNLMTKVKQKQKLGVVRFLLFFGQFLTVFNLIPNDVTPRISEQLSEFRLVQ